MAMTSVTLIARFHARRAAITQKPDRGLGNAERFGSRETLRVSRCGKIGSIRAFA